MNRSIRIFFLSVVLISSTVSGSYAQYGGISDSVYIAQLSKIDKSKLYKVALLADNPFLCMYISTDNYCGEAVVRLEDYRQWYFRRFGGNTDSFLIFSMSKLMGDTLFTGDTEMAYHRVRDIPKSDNLKKDLDSCLFLCNNGLFDYVLIASLFHSNILIENWENFVDDAPPYIRFRFYYYNGTSDPFMQTNKLLNMSLINFLDSILPQQRFYLVMNSDFEPAQDFVQRYQDLLIRSFPCWNSKVRKEIPKGTLVISLDSFHVFDGDCILSYKSFVANKTISKGKTRFIAQNPKFIRFRYSYCEKQLDWVLKTVQSYSL